MSLLLAIIGHLVGDYLLQNDWMALHKKEKNWPCFIHCWIWTHSVCLFAGWMHLSFVNNQFAAAREAAAFFILLGAHYLQDRTNIIAKWMDLIGQHKFRTGPCAPWSMIVVDNVWHIVTIWAVWKFLIP